MRNFNKIHAYRVVYILFAVLITAISGTVAAAADPTDGSDAARQLLAPSGKLRVCLMNGRPASILASEPLSNSLGVGFELGRELARKLNVPYEPIVITPGTASRGITSGECEVAFAPSLSEPTAHSIPFLQIEQGYLVPYGSKIHNIGDVDQSGTKLGYSSTTLSSELREKIRKANVMYIDRNLVSERFETKSIDAYAAGKDLLFYISEEISGSQVLDGNLGIEEISAAVGHGSEAALPYIQHFLDEAKTSGLLESAMRRADLRGAIAK